MTHAENNLILSAPVEMLAECVDEKGVIDFAALESRLNLPHLPEPPHLAEPPWKHEPLPWKPEPPPPEPPFVPPTPEQQAAGRKALDALLIHGTPPRHPGSICETFK